jgi:hypothetical protein
VRQFEIGDGADRLRAHLGIGVLQGRKRRRQRLLPAQFL